MHKMKHPALVLGYNRANHLAVVLARLAELRVEPIYISIDGPGNDQAGLEKCKATRQAAEKFAKDYQGACHLLFHEENMGCKAGVEAGIDWFFENEDQGIIIEDDILPTKQFIEFQEFCLEHYRDVASVASISGMNRSTQSQPIIDHYFSNFFCMWGWATWRDRWVNYRKTFQFDIPLDLKTFLGGILPWTPFPDREIRSLLQRTKQSLIDTWDYQFQLWHWQNGFLSVHPHVNLCSNIGIMDAATHTTKMYYTKPSYMSGCKRDSLILKRKVTPWINPYQNRRFFYSHIRVGLCRKILNKLKHLS
jgi:GR25 family glycosyltransferase involved in LPS biosynthesis